MFKKILPALIVGLILAGGVSAANVILGGKYTDIIGNSLKLYGVIYDSTMATGTAGQMLSSTGTSTKWISGGTGGGDMYKSTYDPSNVNEQLTGLTAIQALTNKTLNSSTNYIDADALHEIVFNNSGGVLATGTPVHSIVWNVGQNAVEVDAARADSFNRMPAVCITEETIQDGATGSCRSAGILTGVNTNVWSDGVELYVAPTGGLTAIAPTATNQYVQQIAIVKKQNATDGILNVFGAGVQHGTDQTLATLHVTGSSTFSGTTTVNNGLKFNFTTSPYSNGLLWYEQSNTNGDGLVFYNSNNLVSMNIGREVWKHVRNCNSGSDILEGTAVYISGATGQIPCVLPAYASTSVTASVVGIATQDINNNNNGEVTIIGVVNGLNTSVFADGAILYLSTSTTGKYRNLTDVRPNSPFYAVSVGEVDYSHSSLGKIEVNAQHPMSLSNLADIQITNPVDNQILQWKASLGYWANTNDFKFSGTTTISGPTSLNAFAGFISDCALTSAGGGAVSAPTSTAVFFTDSTRTYTNTVTLASTTITLTDLSANYIVGDYVNRNFTALTDPTLIDYVRYIPYAESYRSGSNTHIQCSELYANEEISKQHDRQLNTNRYAIQSGLNAITLGTSGTTTIAGGVIWSGSEKFTLPTSGTSTRDFYAYHVGGVWTSASALDKPIDFVNYDNGTALASITPAYYGITYIYRGVETPDHAYYQQGNADYPTQSAALAAPYVSSVPPLISSHAALIGRIIYQAGTTTGYTVQLKADTNFSGATALPAHNALSGLDFGSSGHTGFQATLATSSGLQILANTLTVFTGYNIPLTASTSNWESFYVTPSGRISLGTGLAWSGNTIQAASGYIIPLIASTTEWAAKVSSQWITNGNNIAYTNGNVGIGTTSPLAPLHISSSTSPTIRLDDNNGRLFEVRGGTVSNTAGLGTFSSQSFSLFTSNISRIWLTNSGFLGIGTSTPDATLHVYSGAMHLNGAFKDSTNATGTIGQVLWSTGTSTQWVSTSTLGLTYVDNDPWGATTSGNIYYNGASAQVGIATSVPAYALDVVGKIRSTLTMIVSAVSTLTTTIAGEFGIDTTSGQWRYFDGIATRVLTYEYESTMTIASSTWSSFGGATATSTLIVGAPKRAETWTNVYCITDVGTSSITFQGAASTTQVMVCGTSGTDTALSSNNVFAAREKRRINIGTFVGNPNQISITVTKNVNAD